MPGKVWHEITYPFPNYNGTTVDAWERVHYATLKEARYKTNFHTV